MTVPPVPQNVGPCLVNSIFLVCFDSGWGVFWVATRKKQRTRIPFQATVLFLIFNINKYWVEPEMEKTQIKPKRNLNQPK